MAQVITAVIGEEPDELVKFLNGLMKYHRLKPEELQELDSYLFSLGLRLENHKIEVIPPTEDFFKVFEESLKRPVARPATEGTKDGAIITLCEKINSMNKESTLVDYGCGPGRLVYGLSIIDKQALSKMTYIGVDINPDYLKEIEEAIRALGFDRQVKEYRILSVEDFRKEALAIDFVFLINVLHEINLFDLPFTLKDLEWKLKKSGHMIIHEMRELPVHELGFVLWDADDFLVAFAGTSLEPHIHAYETKSGVPLVNVDLVKTSDTKTGFEHFERNLLTTYAGKLGRTNLQLQEIKKSGKKNVKYASLLVLKDNVETQLHDYERYLRCIAIYGPMCKLGCPDCRIRDFLARRRGN